MISLVTILLLFYFLNTNKHYGGFALLFPFLLLPKESKVIQLKASRKCDKEILSVEYLLLKERKEKKGRKMIKDCRRGKELSHQQ